MSCLTKFPAYPRTCKALNPKQEDLVCCYMSPMVPVPTPRPRPKRSKHKHVLTVEAQADEDDLCQQEQQGEESQAEGCPAPGQPHRLLRS